MNPVGTARTAGAHRGAQLFLALVASATSLAAQAEPVVQFDFGRVAEYHELECCETDGRNPNERLVEVVLPISVRFRDVAESDVHEIDVEIDATAAGLKVGGFAPTTQLASEVVRTIETTTTTSRGRSLEGTLGGGLPVPFGGELIAHVTPSVTAGASGSETSTQKVRRLPPLQTVVVSGTSSRGHGVFFKLKRSSQTSLEGVHELSVTFRVPEDWQGDVVYVACTARGRRRVLWMDQQAILGRVASPVQLYRHGDAPVREAAELRTERRSAAQI